MRHLVLLILLLGIFLAPWWAVMAALVVSVLLYRRFFQALIPAVLLDLMHGNADFIHHPLASATLIISIILLVGSFFEMYLRDNVRI